MKNNRAIDHSTEKLFETTLQSIQGRLEVRKKDPDVGLKLLTRFDELNGYDRLFVHKVTELKGKAGSFIILLAEKHLTIVEHRRGRSSEKKIEEVEPVLIFSIPQDIGRAYIKKETLGDKIADLFFKVDIDFTEYPTFSKNYYVVGEKPEELRKHLPKGLMESLNKIEGMTVEINGNRGLVRPEKNLTEGVLMLLLSIGYKMTK